jgi:hypothetical protein
VTLGVIETAALEKTQNPPRRAGQNARDSCANSGGSSGGCIPISDPLGSGFQYVSGGTGTDLWLSINADASSVTLTFTSDAAGNFGWTNMTVLELAGIQTMPDTK